MHLPCSLSFSDKLMLFLPFLQVGDLSGKYGSLENKSSINETFTDLYAPLFGKYSIVGRSIVIHRPTGARWVCASIGYPGPVIVANADFNGDVEGTTPC